MLMSHSVTLSGLMPSTTYHYQAQSTNAQGDEGVSTDYTFTTVVQPTDVLLELRLNRSEVSGSKNGSAVTPTIKPSGFKGTVVAKGSGSVNYVSAESGNGVYFLGCCGNSNNAYYQFSGATVGNIFNMSQGKVSFALQSRYSFAQRVASTSSPRYAFDVQDGSGQHPFYFVTEVASGYLMFAYGAAGAAQYYFVPAGTEDKLYGNGVLLQVTVSWGSGTLNLYLNGALVKSTSYTAGTANWAASTIFTLGAYQYLTFGGYNSSDDAIAEFTVTGPANGVVSQANASQGLISQAAPRANKEAPAAGPAVSASRPMALSCAPGLVTARQHVVCEVSLDKAATDEATQILLSSDNGKVRVPPSVRARSGQSAIRFQVEVAPVDVQTTAAISAQAGNSAVQTNLTFGAAIGSTLTVPEEQTVRPKSTVHFNVTATDSNDMPIMATATNLPPGSSFDAESGTFEWQPTESDLGEHKIAFSAAAADGSIAKTVAVRVESGQPALEVLENGANEGAPAVCAPGSVAVLTGHSLSTEATPAADHSGASTELNGTRVLVNGTFVPVLYGSPERVSFLCPAWLPAGSALQITVQTIDGKSNALTSEMADSAPGIFTTEAPIGTKARALSESGELSQIPTPDRAGLPILPQSSLILMATGVPCDSTSKGQLFVKVEQQYVAVQSIRPAVQYAGVCEISIQAPDISGDSLAVVLEALGSDGRSKVSNAATISIAKR